VAGTDSGELMRAATFLMCLCFAGCAAPTAAVAPDGASPTAAAAPAAPPAAAPAQTANAPEPELREADRLMQARAACWMKVERVKIARDIDRRIVFVDKCVADAMKKE
jgi:hypothetical protein